MYVFKGISGIKVTKRWWNYPVTIESLFDLAFFQFKISLLSIDGCVVCSIELDALGDELLLDDDSSYLDEASTAPAIPEGTPGDRSTNRVMTNTRVKYMAKFLLQRQTYLVYTFNLACQV